MDFYNSQINNNNAKDFIKLTTEQENFGHGSFLICQQPYIWKVIDKTIKQSMSST